MSENRVAKARKELREALEDFDQHSGAVQVVRLANAIEDVIDARIAALLSVPSSEPKS